FTSTHSCFTCKGRHHTLLHRGSASSKNAGSSSASPPAQQSSRPSSRNASASTSTVQNYFASGTSAVLLGTAITHPYNVCHLGTNYRARPLIDPGSEATFISEQLFKLIKLPFRNVQTQVSGLNQSVSAKSTRIGHFSTVRQSGKLPSHPISKNSLKNLPSLQWADPTFFES
ncbi:hypothetical protein KR054_012127, partial [Drosophila jambulina]